MSTRADTPRSRRIIGIIGAAIVIELALYGLSRLAPALATLLRSAYIGVAILALLFILNAARARDGGERRQGQRRDR